MSAMFNYSAIIDLQLFILMPYFEIRVLWIKTLNSFASCLKGAHERYCCCNYIAKLWNNYIWQWNILKYIVFYTKTRRPPKNSDKYSKLKQIHVISCDEEKISLKANSVHVRLAYLFRLINVAFVYIYRCLYRGCIKTFVTYAYVYPIVWCFKFVIENTNDQFKWTCYRQQGCKCEH